ncbi:MAG: hypothetical protein ACP5TL_01260 [Candidatus Micrarchaeia archaeon]
MRLNVLKEVYSPRYLVLNLTLAIAYFFLIKLLIAIQTKTQFFSAIPQYMIALLSISSSITLTVAIYSIIKAQKNKAKYTATTASIASIVIGSLVGGCGCQVSILASLLGIFASSSVFAINVIIAENSYYIITIIILINIFVYIYYMSKLSRPSCGVGKGGVNEAEKRKER